MGAEGRVELLRALGRALELHPEFFSSALAAKNGNGEGEDGKEGEGKEVVVYRPGYMVDYLYGRADAGTREVRMCVRRSV